MDRQLPRPTERLGRALPAEDMCMPQELTTVERGDRFRDAVAAILRTKYADVQTEVRVGHKSRYRLHTLEIRASTRLS